MGFGEDAWEEGTGGSVGKGVGKKREDDVVGGGEMMGGERAVKVRLWFSVGVGAKDVGGLSVGWSVARSEWSELKR